MKSKLPPQLSELITGASPTPSSILDSLEKVGIDWIGSLSSTPQDPIWHAEGDVRTHTEMVIAEAYAVAESKHAPFLDLTSRAALIISAALHDIGKMVTTREEIRDGKIRIVSPRHARVGRSYLATRLPGSGIPETLHRTILGCVGHHHDLKALVVDDAPAFRYARLSRSVDLRLVYLLEQADIRGRICPDATSLLDDIELFKISSEAFGVWGSDYYSNWPQRISQSHHLRDEGGQIGNYLLQESRRAFEHGIIATPEEGVARAFGWCRPGDHADLVLVCGSAGSGKSTWIKANLPEHEVISLDIIREEIAGERDNQSMNGQVFQKAKELLKDALRRHVKVVWDATSLRSDGRAQILGLGHDYHAATRVVAFATPPAVASRQNRARKHPIPTSVLERQLDRLEWPFVWDAHKLEIVQKD